MLAITNVYFHSQQTQHRVTIHLGPCESNIHSHIRSGLVCSSLIWLKKVSSYLARHESFIQSVVNDNDKLSRMVFFSQNDQINVFVSSLNWLTTMCTPVSYTSRFSVFVMHLVCELFRQLMSQFSLLTAKHSSLHSCYKRNQLTISTLVHWADNESLHPLLRWSNWLGLFATIHSGYLRRTE